MSTPGSMNLTARAAHWSAAHRRKAVLGWLAFVVVAFVTKAFTLLIGADVLQNSRTTNSEVHQP